MALTTYPLNNIEYSAEDAELFHVTRTSGVYAKNSFDYSVTGADNTIIIGTGIGWIKNSEFSGKVIALKDKASLDMGLPDSVYPRIDAIVIQFDANMNATNIIVKNGTASSEPIPPEVSRDETVYELHLYHVKREAGSLSITPSNITDLRLNSSYCGLMADSVTSIDTSAIEKQVADLIKSLQNEISNVKDGSAYLLRNGSTKMTGNLQMDGHKVTELGAPTEDGDAVSLKYASGHYAPAGFGLGADSVSVDSWDDATKNGYYKSSKGTPDGDGNYWHGIVVNYSGVLCNQLVWKTWGTGSVMATRRINNSILEEWEWVNPPMTAGAEYRTTERYQGKPVYTKLVLFTGIPKNTEKIVAHEAKASRMLRIAAQRGAGGTLPMRYQNIEVAIYADRSNIHVFSYNLNNAITDEVCVQLWYTKD